MTTNTTVISRPNPYVGPRPYREGETIYGRERETSELLDILIAERIVLLYSASGAGKSSLLNAAILPRMAEQGFQVYPTIRLNMEPPSNVELGENFNRYVYSCLQSIEEGLPEEQRFSVEELIKLKFKDYLVKYHDRAHKAAPEKNADGPILLVIDQAEEVVRILMTDRPKKLDFFVQLGEVLRDKNIWALVAMREDYLASFDPYLRPIPTRLANRYRLTFLDFEAAIKAIQLPAQSVGVDFPIESATQLVDDLRAVLVQLPDGSAEQELGPTVEPVQLQVVCRRLWSNLPPSEKTVSTEHIKSVGSVNRALADYYALQTASVANMAHVPEREIREWFDRKLITASGIRGQVLLTPDKSDGLENETIWMLERAYLIRAEKRGGATWFELAHDRFVRPIRENNAEWIDRHLNSFQRRADLWNLQGRPDSLLLIGKEFPSMEAWVKANPKIITLVEKDFYRDSVKAHENVIRERRTEILIRWLLVGSVISTIVAFMFFIRSHIAEQSALARGLAAASLSSLQTNPELSVLLAIEGWHVTTTPHVEVIQALHRALPEMRIVNSSIQAKNGHSDKIYNVVYSPDGKFLASASKDGTVKIWDVNNLSVLKTLKVVDDLDAHGGYGAFGAAYSPDGKLLAVVAADGRLTVWDVTTWQLKYQVAAHQGIIYGVAYSHDGKYIATGGEDSVARVWDAASGKKVYDLSGDKGNKTGIQAVVFSKDDSILFTGGDEDKSVYAWDIKTGQFSYTLSNSGSSNTINGLAVSPDGRQLASSGSDRLIRLWNLDTKSFTMEIPGHADWVYGMAYTVDGKQLISASADRTIRIWDVAYGRNDMVLTGATDQVFWVSVDPNGRYLTSASADNLIRVWDISVRGSREIMTLDHQDRVRDVVFSPDGKMLASAGVNGVINLWDAATGGLVRQLNMTAARSAESMFWSYDGHYIAAGYSSGQTIIWDMTTHKAALILQGHGKGVSGVALNGDYSRLATGDDAGLVHLYDTKTGAELMALDANQMLNWQVNAQDLWVNSVLFSPDNQYVAASYSTGPVSRKGSIIIWDLKSGKAAMTLLGHGDIVQNLAYNADGSLLASASDDGDVILWDTNPAIENHLRATLKGHIALVYDVAFSPDGKFLASGGGDGILKVWTVESGTSFFDLYGNEKSIRAVAFSPDGKHIVSGSDDNTIRFYTFDHLRLLEIAQGRMTRSLTDAECNEYMNDGTQLHVTCQEFKNSDPLKPITDIFNTLFIHR